MTDKFFIAWQTLFYCRPSIRGVKADNYSSSYKNYPAGLRDKVDCRLAVGEQSL